MLTEFPFLLLALAEITALLLRIYQGADTITICLRMCLCAYTFIHEIHKKILKANFKFCGGKYSPPKSLSICMGLYFQAETMYKRNEHNIP